MSWYENLVDEEMPPRWMWPFEEELEVWFDRITEERKDRYSGSSVDNNTDDDSGLVLSNEFARGRG